MYTFSLYFWFQIAFVSFVVFVLKYVWNRRRFYLLASKIPGISIAFAFVKILKNFGSEKNIDFPKIADSLIDICYSHGTPKKIWVGPYLFVFIISPEDTKMILNSWDCIEKSPVTYGALECFIQNTLLVKPGNLWKVERKKMIPIFSKFACDNYVEKMDEICEIFLEKLTGKTKWPEHELEIFCQNIAIDAFIKLLAKTDILNTDDYQVFATNMESIVDITLSRLIRFWLLNDFLFQFSSMHKKCKENLANIKKLNTKVIEARSKERNTSTDNSSDKCFLDILLDMHEKGEIDMKNVHNEFQTMGIAAFETSSSAIKNILTLLAMHPNVQQKLYEEVKDIFQNTDRPVCVEDTRKMVYLEMVIKETLRVFNTPANLGRVASKDIKLTEYVIPKGANIVFSPYLMHNNPKYWPDPDKFDPERFSVENSVNRHPYTFLAFSGGPRNCIGYKFEMNLLKTLFSKLVFRYSLQTDATMSDVTHNFSLSIKWSCNHPIVITPRNKTGNNN